MTTSASTLRLLAGILVGIEDSETLEEAKQFVVKEITQYISFMEEEFHGKSTEVS